MKIAVAGGTGLMGRLVIAAAEAHGHDTVVLARSRGVDLVTGDGVPNAVRGVDAVVDVSNVGTLDPMAATAFFEASTASLLAAEREAGVGHHIALSIVGVDRAPYGYYAGKRAQETAIERSDAPWTVLRATQFHEFAAQMHRSASVGPIHVAPRMRTQPIAAREVAARLVDLAEAVPTRAFLELAGPREESLVDMIRRWARVTGHRGWIPAVPLPGPLGRAQRDGTLLPTGEGERGDEDFAAWLARTGGRI